MNTARKESMARHPAGKGRPAPVALVPDPEPAVKVVYSTATGDEPKGAPTLTQEATELPPPAKKITRPRVKKATPRHRPKRGSLSELHTNIKVDPRIMAEVRKVVRQGKYTVVQIVDAETVIVR